MAPPKSSAVSKRKTSASSAANPTLRMTDSTIGSKRKLQTADDDSNDEGKGQTLLNTLDDSRPKKAKPADEVAPSSLMGIAPISLKDKFKDDVAMDDASSKKDGTFVQRMNASNRKFASSKSNKNPVPDTQVIPRPPTSGQAKKQSAVEDSDFIIEDVQEEHDEPQTTLTKANTKTAGKRKADATGASKRKLDSSRTPLALPGESGGPKALTVWRQKWYGTGCEEVLKDRGVWDFYVANWKRLGVKVTTQVKAEALYWHEIEALKAELQHEIEVRGPDFQFRENKTLAESLAELPAKEEDEEQAVAPPTTSKGLKTAKTPTRPEMKVDAAVASLTRDNPLGKTEKKLWKPKPVQTWIALSEEELRKAARKRRVDLTPHPQDQWAHLLAKHDLLDENKPIEDLQSEFDHAKQGKLHADDEAQASPTLPVQSEGTRIENVSPPIAKEAQVEDPDAGEIKVPSTRPVPSKRPEPKKSPSKPKLVSSAGVTKSTSPRMAEKKLRMEQAERLLEEAKRREDDDDFIPALGPAALQVKEGRKKRIDERKLNKAMAEANKLLKKRREAEGDKEWMQDVQQAIFDALKKEQEAGKPVKPMEKLGDGGGSEEKLVTLFAGKSIQWYISNWHASRGIQLSLNCDFNPDDDDDPGFWSEEE
ncbi:uncharacterized protein BDZ99DRAFT_503086 [Mytilinidion resinicola]|uniref:Uncharacterized protein n=1 Tax=Mytilinidion resinicola TaxID=574789 RepID=A0A6A6Y4W6_9PEZI|nr:uncharacterized protein BDZ99DRAFT_503086 [Mytilinidion resinicola]KAF2803891.1 hypothetical protein BDZ99DRAFT_503086 [Mytilinidion resinicola]